MFQDFLMNAIRQYGLESHREAVFHGCCITGMRNRSVMVDGQATVAPHYVDFTVTLEDRIPNMLTEYIVRLFNDGDTSAYYLRTYDKSYHKHTIAANTHPYI